MRPTEKIERLIEAMSFQADQKVDEALWIDTLRSQAEQKNTIVVSGRRLIWEILMTNKTIRFTIACILLAGAVAVGVETLRPAKPNKAYAFRIHLQPDTALDLDPKAAIPLSQARPTDFDVTWDNENGGTLRTVAGTSLRILSCPLIDPDWDGAVSWAYSDLEKLRNNTAVAVAAAQETPFVAVLTSEGNLAVVRIESHNETGAWLSWQVMEPIPPGYSPVRTLTLHAVSRDSAIAQPCAVDLDSGQIVEIPPQVLRMTSNELLAWLEQKGVDALARLSTEGSGLDGVGLIFQGWMSARWARTDPIELRRDMTRVTSIPREPLLFRDGQYQPTFAFRTHEGAIGMLQLLSVDKSKQTVQFRFRMLQEEGGEAKPDNNAESEQLVRSVKNLRLLGLAAFKYAEDHQWQYPPTVNELKGYAKDFDLDFQWILDNVEYVGAGKRGEDPGDTLIAYDKTLLATGKGTHAVFRDGHLESMTPERLQKYGVGVRSK